ncbi:MULTISPECIES: DUF697 domain-containing protein [Deefgea]|uniref:DUF697 domain-containing protein n=1 Tax=Deefgea chitinilytica TaxID=570276 RepID=A0ABS2CA67_9NEIS|nr:MULTISPECIES: DUF697 domain-containing protein [Deefgea]MBM5571034.1 DUF697 domain-containing protein [Deefgea chitinilytica]MBM9888264.1 DUF697 domain-containing protein [Deefgea sp. CFH1-16]
MRTMTLAEIEQIRTECRELVAKRAMASGALAVVPIPGLDVAADVAIMKQMIEMINEKFALTPSSIQQLDPKIKQRIFVIATSLGSTLVGKYMTKELLVLAFKRVGVRMASKQAAKFVPLLGSAIAAGISYGAMRMLGNAHIEDCYQVLKAMQTDGRTFEHETAATDTQ